MQNKCEVVKIYRQVTLACSFILLVWGKCAMEYFFKNVMISQFELTIGYIKVELSLYEFNHSAIIYLSG